MRLKDNDEQARCDLVRWLIDFRNGDGISDLVAAVLIAKVKRINLAPAEANSSYNLLLVKPHLPGTV
jgi:hypothetical protein